MRNKRPPRIPTHLLAFDPGEHAGIVLFEDGKIIASAPANGSAFRTLAAVSQMLCTHRTKPGLMMAVCEDGWLIRGNRGAHTLAMRRGLAQAAAESCMISANDFTLVSPSTWQNALFGPGKNRDTKALGRAYALEHAGLQTLDDNIADAACVGLYWLSQLGK